MACPKCQSSDIDDSGLCLVCGFQIEDAQDTPAEENGQEATDRASLQNEELPEWRHELTRRLEEIKHRRKAENQFKESPRAAQPLTTTNADDAPTTERKSVLERPMEMAGASPAAAQARTAGASINLLADKGTPAKPKEPVEGPLFQTLNREKPEQTPAPAASTRTSASTKADSEIENLIDSIMARQVVQPPVLEPGENDATHSGRTGVDRLILLSRTLSGLIDLLVVFLCGSAFILAADTASGIVVFDTASQVHYFLLLVAIFFVYSVFFLGTTSQTIGMMITDLRLIGAERRRPKVRHIMIRCTVYLLSLFGLGLGLIWGCFDPSSACLHDKASHTRIVRLSPYGF